MVRINCRLPQTPRTPTAAAAHYFDDVFSKPSGTQPKIRRSSTTRSIGNRSSLNVSASGDLPGEDDDEVHGSVQNEQQEKERRKSEANEHVAKYVTDQLERIQSNESVFDEDEFEAQLE